VLLNITTTHRPATDVGYLLHTHPDRVPQFSLPFGSAHVLYPEATEERCTAALVLDIDPVALERFVPHEPLNRVHDCVFAVLALESRPVDPRL
jgi:Hen1-like subunit of RNA repair complex/PNKP (polynucleotide 5'-kinase/3'-phosphatase) family adenylyltransferase-like protein